MKPSVWRRLDLFARQILPCVSILAMLLLGVVPLRLPGLHSVAPSLPLIAVFYWTLYRPDLMPALAVFLLGFLQDVLFGLPLGVSACTLVLVHAAVNMQRRFFSGKSFGVVWLGFSVVAMGAAMLGWVLVCAYHAAFVVPFPAIFQALTTIGFFPILSWALLRCQLSLLRQA